MPGLHLMPFLGCGVRPGVSGFKDQSHPAGVVAKDAVFSHAQGHAP